MTLHVLDLHGQDFQIPANPGMKVGEALQLIKQTYQIDTSRTYICYGGTQLSNSDELPPETATLTLFSSVEFPEKSYPRVDHALNLSNPKYEVMYIEPMRISIEKSQKPDEGQDVRAELLRLFDQAIEGNENIGDQNMLMQLLQHIHGQPQIGEDGSIQIIVDGRNPLEFVPLNPSNEMMPPMDFIPGFPGFGMERFGVNQYGTEEEIEQNPDGGEEEEEEPPRAINPELFNFDIDLTPEDNEAIQSLMRYGNSRSEVIQVYLACERNRETAEVCLLSMN